MSRSCSLRSDTQTCSRSYSGSYSRSYSRSYSKTYSGSYSRSSSRHLEDDEDYAEISDEGASEEDRDDVDRKNTKTPVNGFASAVNFRIGQNGNLVNNNRVQ